ncbi:MAG: hypothetical protein GXY70_08125 [Euryarchaeota archaeon]|nr:hypothetical protein [Euryarchaeota archaeon]
MGALAVCRADILFLETFLIFAALCAMSIISMFFLQGHFKVNTTFRGYTVQAVVLLSRIEALLCRGKLRHTAHLRRLKARLVNHSSHSFRPLSISWARQAFTRDGSVPNAPEGGGNAGSDTHTSA